MSRPDHSALSLSIHADNVAAGWWTDLQTGEPLVRNFPELLCLAHSEISEALEGWMGDKEDDHLPQYLMHEVEIADTCIRLYDALGGFFSDVPTNFVDQPPGFPRGFFSVTEKLAYLHLLISRGLEAYRKSRMVEAKRCLYAVLDACFEFANDLEFNLLEVIEAKREYNRHRADHKPENRKLEDGKKI